jgi:hypothetical protein
MGLCGTKTKSTSHHVMLAGIENSGKTFFLYTALNNFIKNNKIRTKPTEGN